MMLNVKNGLKDKKYRIKHIGITNKKMLYRLGAMGVTKGSEISIKQQCLLNGPSIVEINGQYLSIRQSDARLIALED
ncbi:FeoA domain protein [Staphylococcus caprae M23864:W1]|nr:FeoA domain protein [Staphylococcus caprae M23864:W1]SUL94635.1 FeoA family protein [Staphylococcus caprae]